MKNEIPTLNQRKEKKNSTDITQMNMELMFGDPDTPIVENFA